MDAEITIGWIIQILWVVVTVIAFTFQYVSEALLLHCFYDEGIKLTTKKFVIALVSSVFVNIVSVPASVMLYGFYDDEEKIGQMIDAVNNVCSILIILVMFALMIFQKGIGFRKTVCRFFVAVFTYYLLSLNLQLVCNMTAFCISETTYLTKGVSDFSFDEMVTHNIMYYFGNLALIAYLYFNYYKKGFSVRPRKIDRVALVLYAAFVVVIVNVVATTEKVGSTDVEIKIKEPVVRVLIAFVLLVLIIAVPIVLIRGRVNAYYKEVNTYQQTFLETELNASKQYKAAQEDTRAFRHDVQNNLSVVAMLMEQGKVEEAQRYLNDMRTEVNALSPKVVTGDEMIDSIVSSKMPKMEEAGIKFSLDGVIDGGLDWKPMDICTVFANMIDNAIEAATQTDSPFIDLQFKKTDHHRLVRASNSCTADVDCEKLMSGEAHVTTKSEKHLHGYGVGNIRKTVEKYGGMMRLTCENRVFTMELILKK